MQTWNFKLLMRVANLILTYNDPEQTERMIKNMVHEDFDFYIHVDKKSDIEPFLFIKALPNVYFIKNRVKVTWAGFSTVKAIFSSIKELVGSGVKYDFINLMSGQDYPIKPAALIAEVLRQNIGKELIHLEDIRNEWQEGLIRMENYFLADYTFKGRYTIEKVINFIMPKRKLPHNLHPYGRSMFWMLSPEAAMFVVKRVEKDRKLQKFFSLCWGTDEFVFHTILMDSPFKERIINNNYRYIDWSRGGAHPKILDENDFAPIEQSEALFIRKVKAPQSSRLMNLIDHKLLI